MSEAPSKQPQKPEVAPPETGQGYDPITFLSNIIERSAVLSAQWGDNIMLHMRVAALWYRIGKRDLAATFLTNLAALHAVDEFRLGEGGTRMRLDYIRYFFSLVRMDASHLDAEALAAKKKKQERGPTKSWFQDKVVARFVRAGGHTEDFLLTLDPEEQRQVYELIYPQMTWLEQLYLTRPPGDTRPPIMGRIRGISESAHPMSIEQALYALFDACTEWHERRSDTPIWVHDLDDVGPRAIYLAITIENPGIIGNYLRRCIDTLHDHSLALMPSAAEAVGGLAYLARTMSRDDVLRAAIDYMVQLPEYERCISALTLVEVMIEQGYLYSAYHKK